MVAKRATKKKKEPKEQKLPEPPVEEVGTEGPVEVGSTPKYGPLYTSDAILVVTPCSSEAEREGKRAFIRAKGMIDATLTFSEWEDLLSNY